MQNAVSNKIRLLKNIKPNPDWLKSQRSNLLLEISQTGKQSRLSWRALPGFLFSQNTLKPARLLARPVLVFGIVLGLIFGGGFLLVQAAKIAMPGDLLYPVKIAIENAHLKISSQENKSKFQAELIEVRVRELSQIINSTDDPAKKKEQIVKTMDKLQAQAVSAKVQLDKIKQGEPQKVAETASLVGETTARSEKVLIEAKEKLVQEEGSQEMVSAIDAAVKEIKETSTLAAELKEEKTGTTVHMEVKETEPEVEEFEEASISFEEINK